MRPVQFISGVIMAVALQAGTAGIAVAETLQGYEANGNQSYHALARVDLSGSQASKLLQMSDMQLAAVVGGAGPATPSQTTQISNEAFSAKMSQIVNQLLAGQGGNQTGSTSSQSSTQTIEGGDGRVTAEQVQTSTQINSPQSGNTSSSSATPSGNQLTNLPPVQVVITRLPDGRSTVVVQQGQQVITTLVIPYPISPQTWFQSIPFQSAVTVSKDVVQNIQAISGPMLGNPSMSIMMRH